MTTFRQQFSSLLEPILDAVKNDDDFPRRELIYTRFYGENKQSRKATETRFERAGIGDFQEKPEGQSITYSDPIAGSELKFTHIRRALGYKITQEMLDHDQYDEIRKLERDLQIAGQDDLEVRGHLLLNNAFGTTDNGSFASTGFDGLQLCTTAHTRLDGGATQRNRPSTDVNLSWTSLADARQQFQLWVDHRGRNVISMPSTLVVHPADELTAMEIMQTAGKPGTANNDKNVIAGDFEIVVTPFLTDSNSWFLFAAKAQLGTIWYWDVQPRTASLRDDEEREIVSRKRVQGWSHGHDRWFGVYGTSGVS